MDPFEDNHIVANPARVMVAQLRQGEKPPFVKRAATEPAPAAEKATEKKDDPARFRVDVDGLASRVYSLPVDPGNYFHLVAGTGPRRVVRGAAVHRGRVRGDLPPRAARPSGPSTSSR